jgi:hypothetical protein
MSKHRISGIEQGNRVLATVAAGLLVWLATCVQAKAAWTTATVKVGDGHGRCNSVPAQKQAIVAPGCKRSFPFGLVQMDNNRIAMVLSVAAKADGSDEHPVIAFSDNGGDTWSSFQALPTAAAGSGGRPMMLTYLGAGNLSYVSGVNRYFSSNHGQTWAQPVAVQSVRSKFAAGVEGNDGVDRAADGNAVRVMEIAYFWPNGEMAGWPKAATNAVFRYSLDQGRTWQGEVQPPTWKYNVTYKGTVYQRGVSEGSVVRAANGSLVAALRTDMPPRFFVGGGAYDDSLEGTGVSISNDNGATWSPVNVLFEAGRHHANLQRLRNNDLLMTLIVRDDIRTGSGLDTHMRGCDALLSHDNGLTWNLERRITLDEFDYFKPSYWVEPQCGHLGTAVLADGSVLTAYGNYLNGTAVLIKWKPNELPRVANRGSADSRMAEMTARSEPR